MPKVGFRLRELYFEFFVSFVVTLMRNVLIFIVP